MKLPIIAGALSPLLALACRGAAPLETARNPSPPVTTPLREVVRQALAHNPSLLEIRVRARAAQEQVRLKGSWQDPQVGLESEWMTDSETSRFGALKITAAQEIPLSGRNRAMARAAEAEAEAAAQRVRERELEVAARTAAAYFEIAGAMAELEIAGRSGSLLEETERITCARYESGERSLSDVLAVQTERADLDRMQVELQQLKESANAELGALLGLPAGTPPPRPEPLRFRPPPDAADLEARALRHRPSLAAAAATIKAARQREMFARRNRIPDPTIELGAKDYPNADMQEWTATVRFSVPWLNPGRLRATEEAARALREAGERRRHELELETCAMVRSHIAKVTGLAEQYLLMRDRVIPLAIKTVESVRAAYETGTAGFAELNIARRRLQEAERTSIRLLTRYSETLATLEAVTSRLPGGASRPETAAHPLLSP